MPTCTRQRSDCCSSPPRGALSSLPDWRSSGAAISRSALRLVILSNFFFGTGENLIAAFLPEIARGEAMGRVSGWGWSLGYCGGLVALGACLAYVTHAQAQGATATEFVPVTMLITAALFAIREPAHVHLSAGTRPTGRRARWNREERICASRRKRSVMRAALRTCGVSWSASCSTRRASRPWSRSPRCTRRRSCDSPRATRSP